MSLSELKLTANAAAHGDDTTPALIFIPDISGFTRFINETKIEKSRNLITDLLEIIIEANILDMTVCEIQGDAVLFYRLGPPPRIDEIVNQCKQIFLDFQNYLRIVEREHAGTLEHGLADSNLTLKVIVHYGNISVTKIKEYTKLMGKDVIVAHRLLKNEIEGNEYVLLSESYLQTQKPEEVTANFEWTQLKDGQSSYEHLGEIKYKYAFLTPLRLLVTDHKPIEKPEDLPNVVSVSATVPVPLRFMLRIVNNFRLKPRWIPGLKAVRFDDSKEDRMRSCYICAFKDSEVEVQHVQSFVGAERVEYVEKLSNFRQFPNALLFYYLHENDNGHTELTLRFHYSRVAVGGLMRNFLARHRIKSYLAKAIERLLKLSAELYNRSYSAAA